ncbi:ABC transporter ATP-binding protein/permease [Ideonella sp. B7]|uniref:ABC transporter ATP-binding protein/permease n=1 Tax=Ideonella benzenivorans TaxID=2831643 RepID=UPI001CECC9E2|nr:ABC transporter ATP-binding protein/permease [Ideonella benzenivorans]MCA6218131.1 ABC transporter ATP-binding protein/permease [Ideonella benzenivorans]
MDSSAHAGFNLRLWQRFATIAAPYWRSEERWRARGLLAALALLLLGQTFFNVMFNQETGEFTSALAAHDAPRFWTSIGRFALLLCLAVPIWGLYYFVRDTLGWHWRRWLTEQFLQRYLGRLAFFRLNAVTALDNPDQRISEDINSFTQQSLYFLMVGLGSLIDLVAFAGVLWSISRPLVLFLIGYALLVTVITTTVFGRQLIGLNVRQLRREADFRFGLVRLREQAEPIAFHQGETHEMGRLRQVFGAVVENTRQILRWQLGLNLFQYGHSFLTLALPSIIIADQVLSGEMEVGRAVQAAGAFSAVLSAMAVIVEHFESLSRFSAGVNRLHEFSATLDSQQQRREGEDIDCEPAPALALQQLTVRTPGGEHLIVQRLSLQVAAGDGLMIVGPSGVGKSSLLRAIAGLWRQGSGRVLRPGGDELRFLPQHPYLPLGDLRSQLLYPELERDISEAELLEMLRRVQLPDLAERVGGLDAVCDWAKLLSTGEQQRLAFARMLIARPRYAVLDEATSALDAVNEAVLYRQLEGLSITPISVSHHPGLRAYHRWVLELQGDGAGGWRLLPAAGYEFPS